MRALKYFVVEAAASLWRGRRAALLAVLTIAGGLFVLGFFLALNTNLQRLVGRWSESAELSVYYKDDATPDQQRVVDELIAQSGLASNREFVSKQQAATRFRQDFPDLASSVERLDANPFPASVEVRLKPEMRAAGAAVDNLATTLAGLAGVADVRYDRRWLSRLNALVRFLRAIGLVIVGLLAVAAAMTVANVVRLAALAREDEIEIMELVGRSPWLRPGPLRRGGDSAGRGRRGARHPSLVGPFRCRAGSIRPACGRNHRSRNHYVSAARPVLRDCRRGDASRLRGWSHRRARRPLRRPLEAPNEAMNSGAQPYPGLDTVPVDIAAHPV